MTPCPFLRQRTGLLRGFTLLEMLVAMMIVSVLLVGMGSAVLISRQAVPDGKKGASAALGAAEAMDRLAGDLFYASSILSSSATDVSFMVADRNGDGASETIRYYWSGTSGDPLMRQVNGGTAATLLEHVREFQLNYLKRSELLPTAYTEADEMLLAKYTKDTYLSSVYVDKNSWCGEHFRPSLPSGATSWRVTRVKFAACVAGLPYEELHVQVRPAVGVLPSTSVLADVTVQESTLSYSYQWKEVTFSDVSGLTPGTGLCLVFKGLSSSDAAVVRMRPYWAYLSDCNYVASSDGGSTWYAYDGAQMLFYVYGKVSTPNPVQYRYLLTGVQATLRSGSDAASRLQTSIPVVNEPEVSGP